MGLATANTEMKAEQVVIDSGLPRSGTSMLMKMLDAGGLAPVIDGIRSADEDNPGGYYEFEKVKQLDIDTQWVESAKGKVVKVISQLLSKLPEGFSYKVVFALREMDEILASQRVMLKRRGQPVDSVSDDEIAALFSRHLHQVREWLTEQKDFDVLFVKYDEVLCDPFAQSEKIKTFLACPLDERQMAGVVDENLHRQRNAPTTE